MGMTSYEAGIIPLLIFPILLYNGLHLGQIVQFLNQAVVMVVFSLPSRTVRRLVNNKMLLELNLILMRQKKLLDMDMRL